MKMSIFFFFFETICRFIFTIQSVTMNKKFIYVDIRFEKEIEYEIREGVILWYLFNSIHRC